MAKKVKRAKDNKRYVYILLSRTHTVLATLIRLYTREPYSHVSISLDAEMNQLYSFGRKWRLIPFIGGFVHEDLEKGVFGADSNTKCRVYKVPVTEEQYAYVTKEINRFVDNKDDFGYNYMGLFGAMFDIHFENDTRYVCSQFVDHVLTSGGLDLFTEDKSVVRPFDFHDKLKHQQIYEGKLCNYKKFLENMNMNEDYAEAI